MPPVSTLTNVTESVQVLSEASSAGAEPGRMRIRLIEGDRWGSSGYYSRSVLERDGAAAFPAGTQMYLDHPTLTENEERPERSVRDLAGQLVEDASYDDDGLYADVEVFAHWRPLIEGVAHAVGLSIRAGALIEEGTAPDGRTGRIVAEIAESNGSHSVDFVTRAGAGGRVVALMESARAVQLHEGHGMTASDLNELLNSAVRDEHGGEGVYVYVRDHTDDWVVFTRTSDGDDNGLFQQNYTVGADGQVTFDGDPVEVVVHTEYRPAADTPVRTSSTVPSTALEETAMTTRTDTDLRESVTALQGQVTQLQESVTTLTQERDAARTELQRREDADRIAEADTAITTALEAVAIPDVFTSVADQIRERARARVTATRDAQGGIVTDALNEAARREVTAEIEALANLAEGAGLGRVRGITGGNGGATGGDTVTEAPNKPEDYQALGVSESTAKILATR